MLWTDVEDLFSYWADCPPTHEMVAAYLGVKPTKKLTTTTVSTQDEIKAFAAAMGVKG